MRSKLEDGLKRRLALATLQQTYIGAIKVSLQRQRLLRQPDTAAHCAQRIPERCRD
nr:hypothetical protein [Solimonas marina]